MEKKYIWIGCICLFILLVTLNVNIIEGQRGGHKPDLRSISMRRKEQYETQKSWVNF